MDRLTQWNRCLFYTETLELTNANLKGTLPTELGLLGNLSEYGWQR